MTTTHPEPIDVATTPILSDAWKKLMKWPDPKVMLRPIDHSNLRDPPEPRTLYLIVKLPDAPNAWLPPPAPYNPLNFHWSLRWRTIEHMEYTYERIVHIERAAPVLHHLTNWGPLTKIYDAQSEPGIVRVAVAELTLEQRRHLERIALTQPVRDPDGRWNCQHWTADVLARATVAEHDAQGQLVHPPILTVKEKDDALWRARNIDLTI